MPPIIFVHDAIQKTFSRVMGSLVSTPLFPLAWENSVCPNLSTTTATQPGILLGSEVTSSMDLAIAATAEGSSCPAIVFQLLRSRENFAGQDKEVSLIVVCGCGGFMRKSRSTVITLYDADSIHLDSIPRKKLRGINP